MSGFVQRIIVKNPQCAGCTSNARNKYVLSRRLKQSVLLVGFRVSRAPCSTHSRRDLFTDVTEMNPDTLRDMRASISRYAARRAAEITINQSINVKFVGRRYTRRPGAPTVVSGTHDLESLSECTGVGNVVEVGRKSVPGGWATVGETSFPKSSSCSWQNVIS